MYYIVNIDEYNLIRMWYSKIHIDLGTKNNQ